jgi:hypothetical protein
MQTKCSWMNIADNVTAGDTSVRWYFPLKNKMLV